MHQFKKVKREESVLQCVLYYIFKTMYRGIKSSYCDIQLMVICIILLRHVSHANQEITFIWNKVEE